MEEVSQDLGACLDEGVTSHAVNEGVKETTVSKETIKEIAPPVHVQESLKTLSALFNHIRVEVSRQALAGQWGDVDARVLTIQLVPNKLKVAVALLCSFKQPEK